MTAFPLMLLILLFALVDAADLSRARMLGWDEAEYAGIGRGMMRGEGYRTYGQPEAMRLPMVPSLVAVTLALAPRSGDRGLRVMALVCMLAALAMTYVALVRVADRRVAFAATAMLGAMPMLRTLATLVMSEAPFLLLFTAAVWAFHDGLEGRPRSYLLAAVAIGLAALTRYVAWLILPIALLMLLIGVLRFGARELARRTLATREFQLAPLVLAVVLAPWLVRAELLFGDPFQGFRDAASGTITWGVEPGSWYATRLPLTAGWPVIVVALLGVVAIVRDRHAVALTALVAGLVVLAAHSSYAHKEDRYVSAMLPFVAALAAIGLERVVTPHVSRVTGGRIGALATPALALGVTIVTLFAGSTRPLELDPAGYRSLVQAMDVVRASSPSGQPVVGASGPLIGWYADRPVRSIPDRPADLPGALAGASWMVFVNFERMQPKWAPALRRMMTAADAAHGDVRSFRDGAFQVVLARADVLAAHLAARDTLVRP